MADKCYYRVETDNEWLYLNQSHSSKVIKSTNDDDFTIYADDNVEDSDRVGYVEVSQIGGVCNETKTVKVTQPGMSVSYSGTVIDGSEYIKTYESNTLKNEYAINTTESTNVTFNAEYYADVKVCKAINGVETTDCYQTTVSFSSSNPSYKDFFSWEITEGENLGFGNFNVSGEGEYNVSVLLNDDGKEFVENSYYFTPVSISGSGKIIQSAEDVYTINVGDLYSCSTELPITFEKNGIELNENQYTIRWSSNGRTGISKAINANTSSSSITYSITATSISDTSKSAKAKAIQPALSDSSYIFYTDIDDATYAPTETVMKRFIVTSSLYNECSGEKSYVGMDYCVLDDNENEEHPIDVTNDESNWLQVRHIVKNNGDGINVFSYSVTKRDINDVDNERSNKIILTQDNSGNKIEIVITQGGGTTLLTWLDGTTDDKTVTLGNSETSSSVDIVIKSNDVFDPNNLVWSISGSLISQIKKTSNVSYAHINMTLGNVVDAETSVVTFSHNNNDSLSLKYTLVRQHASYVKYGWKFTNNGSKKINSFSVKLTSNKDNSVTLSFGGGGGFSGGSSREGELSVPYDNIKDEFRVSSVIIDGAYEMKDYVTPSSITPYGSNKIEFTIEYKD